MQSGRELTKLEAEGILRKEPRGNRIYYSVRPEHPFYGDLISMVAKTTGLGKGLIEGRNKIGKSFFYHVFRKVYSFEGSKTGRGRRYLGGG